MKKMRVVFNLPKNVELEIRMRMVKEGYSMREKSKWISESIENFLEIKKYHELVVIAELVEGFVKQESIYVTSELEEKLVAAVIDVRVKHPTLDGVKSLIVRASITHRLVLSIVP